MYGNTFCKVYNEFGWNYFPEAFGEQLLGWIRNNDLNITHCLDMGCGTGVLCEILYKNNFDISGMDLSESMIAIAKERNPLIHYEVADMLTFHPKKKFDLVTCTGDVLNHIMDLDDVSQIMKNIHEFLNPNGYFIFDLLTENEIPTDEPFALDFDDLVHAIFQVTQDTNEKIHLNTKVYQNNVFQFEETITEIIHQPQVLCTLLQKCGFQILQCSNQRLDNPQEYGTAWYIVAKKES